MINEIKRPLIQGVRKPEIKDPSRRKFISLTTKAAVAGALGAACSSGSQNPETRLENEPVVNVTPDYERTMDEVLLGLEDNGSGIEELTDVLQVLPRYTKVKVIAKPEAIQRLIQQCTKLGIRNPIEEVQFFAATDENDPWSQDWGEAVTYRGEKCILVPMDAGTYDRERLQDRERRLSALYGPNVIKAKYYFEGGNMTFDRQGNGIRVITGNDTVLKTIEMDKVRGVETSSPEVVAKIQRQFNAQDVMLLGPRSPDGQYLLPQAKKAFHIDLSFVLLRNKLAIFNRVPNATFPNGVLQKGRYMYGQLSQTTLNEFIAQQYQIETDMRAANYATIGLQHDAFDLMYGFNSVNAIPYVDADTGKDTIMYPVFSGWQGSESEYDWQATQGRPLTYSDLRGKGRHAFDLYSQLGYVPIPVADSIFAMAGGSIHCRANVLAKLKGLMATQPLLRNES